MRKFYLWFGTVFIFAQCRGVPSASATEIYTEIDSEAYSESFSVKELVSEIKGAGYASGGEAAFLHAQFSAGARMGNWDLAVVTRYDAALDYSEATARLILASSADGDVPDGIYNLALDVQTVSATGLRVGYRYAVSEGLSVKASLTGFQAQNLLDGRISGQLELSGSADAQGDLLLDYYYGNDPVFGQDADAPDGYGYAVDIAVNWQATPALSFALNLDDIVSDIRWDAAPRTVADATSGISRTDEDGLLIIRPALSGQNSTETLSNSYMTRTAVQADYSLNNTWSLHQSVFNAKDIWLSRSGVDYSFATGAKLGATYDWIARAVGVSGQYGAFRFDIATDAADLSKARYLRAQAAVAIIF